jgi:hypothetical protein
VTLLEFPTISSASLVEKIESWEFIKRRNWSWKEEERCFEREREWRAVFIESSSDQARWWCKEGDSSTRGRLPFGFGFS